MAKINLSLYPSQEKFVFSKKKQTIYIGARGCGKTQAMLLTAIIEAKKPNNEVLIVRKTYDELRTKLLPQLLEHPVNHPDNKDNKPLMPPDKCEHNQSKHEIRLNNGGMIRYCSMDDKLKIRGYSVGSVFIDELIEFEEEEYLELLQILRGLNGNKQIYATSNPSNTSSWIYRRFVVERDDTTEYITANWTENTLYAGTDYYDTIRSTHSEDQIKQMVNGEWTTQEGCIYKEFDRGRVLKQYDYSSFKEFFISMDYGFVDPNAFLLIGVNDSYYHVFQELQRNNMLHDDIIEFLNSWKIYTNNVICDPSAAAAIAFIESNGFRCYKANNDVEVGINQVKNCFEKGRLTIDPKCNSLIQALENYKMDSKNKPIHKGSHMPDALRYGIMHQMNESTNVCRPRFFNPQKEAYF
jgi:PBSX family phage terminase large subunit